MGNFGGYFWFKVKVLFFQFQVLDGFLVEEFVVGFYICEVEVGYGIGQESQEFVVNGVLEK